MAGDLVKVGLKRHDVPRGRLENGEHTSNYNKEIISQPPNLVFSIVEKIVKVIL